MIQRSLFPAESRARGMAQGMDPLSLARRRRRRARAPEGERLYS